MQKQEKLNQSLKLKNMNIDLAKSIEKNHSDYLRDEEIKQKQRKEKSNLYKLDLDKQLEEKKIRRNQPIMDENERLMNRIFFT